MPACHLRQDCAWRKRFRDDPPFVLVTPPRPATNATANLDAPSRRGSVNYGRPYMRTDAINWFASSELCRSLQDGGKTPLTPSKLELNSVSAICSTNESYCRMLLSS
jgi:hypothetical protein